MKSTCATSQIMVLAKKNFTAQVLTGTFDEFAKRKRKDDFACGNEDSRLDIVLSKVHQTPSTPGAQCRGDPRVCGLIV